MYFLNALNSHLLRLSQVDEALGRGNTDQVVVDYFNIPMKRSDIQTLKDGTWLNDEVSLDQGDVDD